MKEINPKSTAANPHIGSNVESANSCGINANLGSITGGVFDPNRINAALEQYTALNTAINNIIGYDFKWFRAIPQQRSKDVIFHEYTLYNVEECPIDIKAIIPNGTIPDSKYNYDLMGLEYEIPLEIQIDKKYWESVVGFGTAPQQKDIVYWPLSNKLYTIESITLMRGFMEQETTWRVNLKKYTNEASVKKGELLQETIDKYTVSVEEVFGENINNDIKKLTNETQFSAFNSTSMDLYKSIDTALNIVDENIEIHGAIVAKSYYDLSTPNWYDAITYNISDTISQTEDRAVSAWIRHKPFTGKTFSVKSILPITSYLDASTLYEWDPDLYSQANYYVNLQEYINVEEIKLNDTIIISRPGALNFYAQVVAIGLTPLTYYVAINPFVLEHLNKISNTWNEMSSYKVFAKEPISIIDGVNDFGEHVLSVNLYANQYIAVSFGHTYNDSLNSYNAYVIPLDEKLKDNKWYGIIANIGNTWKQFNVNVWQKNETDKVSKISNIFYKTLPLNPESVHVDHYSINKSPGDITNIRLFSTTIDDEAQNIELLSYFSKDGDKLLIGDNADSKIKLEYINKQR